MPLAGSSYLRKGISSVKVNRIGCGSYCLLLEISQLLHKLHFFLQQQYFTL